MSEWVIGHSMCIQAWQTQPSMKTRCVTLACLSRYLRLPYGLQSHAPTTTHNPTHAHTHAHTL